MNGSRTPWSASSSSSRSRQSVADVILERGPQKGTTFATALGRPVDERRLLLFSTRGTSSPCWLVARSAGRSATPTTSSRAWSSTTAAATSWTTTSTVRSATRRPSARRPVPQQATVTIRLTNTAPSPDSATMSPAGPTNRVVPCRRAPTACCSPTTRPRAPGSPGPPSTASPPCSSRQEQGTPVFSSTLEIGPGQTRVLRLTVEEPAEAKGPVTTLVQPLVRPQQTVVKGADCSTPEAP